MSAARDAVVACAECCVGLTAPAPAYLALVAPAEESAGDEQAAGAVAKVSDCVLVRMGIEEHVYEVPDRTRYVFGSAGELITHRDEVTGVYVASPSSLPQQGDGLHWVASGSAPEHFETVVAINGRIITIVAGGERDGAGHETVARLDRTLVPHGAGWADAHNGRVLAGIIDADGMAERYGLKAA